MYFNILFIFTSKLSEYLLKCTATIYRGTNYTYTLGTFWCVNTVWFALRTDAEYVFIKNKFLITLK